MYALCTLLLYFNDLLKKFILKNTKASINWHLFARLLSRQQPPLQATKLTHPFPNDKSENNYLIKVPSSRK
jgi:hypothetical protein